MWAHVFSITGGYVNLAIARTGTRLVAKVEFKKYISDSVA